MSRFMKSLLGCYEILFSYILQSSDLVFICILIYYLFYEGIKAFNEPWTLGTSLFKQLISVNFELKAE